MTSGAAAIILAMFAIGSEQPVLPRGNCPVGECPFGQVADRPVTAPRSQEAPGQEQSPPAPSAQSERSSTDEDDMSFQPAQPDFTLVNLPTTLRLPRYKMAFRVTHRFTRPLGQGDFTDSLSDLFGLDSGAQIGLEFRFAPIRGGQLAFYRTNDKTIEFLGQYDLWQAGEGRPIGIAALATIEGTNNFQDIYSPSLAVSVSATLADALALYAVPTWVGNTNVLPAEEVEDDNTFMLGVGARVRVRRGLYLVAEAWPRLAGFKGGDTAPGGVGEGNLLASFAIEKQAGGHVFQLNFSNAWATTPANIARGAAPGQTDWYLGFNISRKFF